LDELGEGNNVKFTARVLTSAEFLALFRKKKKRESGIKLKEKGLRKNGSSHDIYVIAQINEYLL